MSKLAQSLKAVQTGYSYPKKSPYINNLTIKEEVRPVEYTETYNEYKITATFEAVFQSSSKNEFHYERNLRNSKVVILEQVFGEFREPIHLLQEALNNQDIEAAQRITLEIYNLMFFEGI